jgi:hypothetical protein
VAVAVDRDELRLLWPADLFAAEARTLLQARPLVDKDAVRGLFNEAFADGRAARLLSETGPLHADSPGGGPWAPTDTGRPPKSRSSGPARGRISAAA